MSKLIAGLQPSPRRRFLKQLLSLAAVAISNYAPSSLANSNLAPMRPPDSLSGPVFDLQITEIDVNLTGNERRAIAVNGSIPGPTLRWREGEDITIRVTNHLDVQTSIHWHGIILPYVMDGAPGISFAGIEPGETFTYRFKVTQAGTYWYHSHSGMQEQLGLYGAIIIDPLTEVIHAEQDYVVQLSDWTDEHPDNVFAKLKQQSDYYNFNQPTVVDFIQDVLQEGWAEAFDKRSMWNSMRMSMTDLADISAYTYTYLINGRPPQQAWSAVFHPGQCLRLRLINSGAQSIFDVRIPGLQMTVVQADGQAVHPVSVDEIRLGVAETYDVLITPTQPAYTLFAQAMDRTGFACAAITSRPGLFAAVPALDNAEPLSMLDMMGDMGGMAEHMQHMQHAGMQHHAAAPVTSQVRHAYTEFGPGVDMLVETPRSNLDDPGIGLRQNGRKVLTYADLRSVAGIVDSRLPERELELHLTGNMERYSWSFDGVVYQDASPIHFKHGERIRIILVNDTMMTHPVHLHGMWSDLEVDGGGAQVRKHTLSVQPAQRISFLVTADALGRWPWHCHLFYHMHAGMMREVVVA